MSDAEAKETVDSKLLVWVPQAFNVSTGYEPTPEPDPVEAFYQRVNARAEAAMMGGKPIEGAHHRALEHEILVHRKNRGK